MNLFLRKLVLGKTTETEKSVHSPVHKRILNIKAIWNNDHQNDSGLEKIIRLFLSISQMLFPGIYIKYFASRRKPLYQDLAMDLYVLSKVAFPILILINHWETNLYILYFMVYLLLETVLYVPTLIFASDVFSKPRSYKRSMLLLFFNYLEIVFAYAVLYSLDSYLNKPFSNWFDAVYFSIVTSSSIGYGDFYPITTVGKMLVSSQAFVFLLFVVLFLNFFSAKIKSKGYFDHENQG